MDRAEEYRDVAEKEKTIYDDTHTHTHPSQNEKYTNCENKNHGNKYLLDLFA